MSELRFVGDDPRWLFETLVEACEVTRIEGVQPALVVNGKKFAPFDLIKVAALLPESELQPHHQLVADHLFKNKQNGYRRTAYNLAHRANHIAADSKWRAARGLN